MDSSIGWTEKTAIKQTLGRHLKTRMSQHSKVFKKRNSLVNKPNTSATQHSISGGH